ncbi:MAG: DUF1343 domain-containing protein [Bacteroidales bacterium]|nr:DUF1343 domain-containing protein [Bacteroidales bacterium]
MKSRLIRKLINSALVILIICFPGCSNAIDNTDIQPGSYQLEKYIKLLEGKRIALVVNHTSVIYNTHILDTLRSRGITIEKVFSPEHGFLGRDGAGVAVGNEKYSQSLIPVISLYGTKKKPAITDMENLELIVFDIQDVGVRFYTYLSTLHYVMEACAENNIPFIVLDRPNPNGFYIDGPVLQKEFRSFIGLHPVPVVYGMTIGEYANMINGEGWLKDSVTCDLTIIRCENYNHSSRYILPVNPSPNLREMRAIYLYPSLAFFEGTIISEGRGTDFPFLVAGHPDYPDHTFSFVPLNENSKGPDPKLKDKTCFGIDLRETCPDSLISKNEIDLSYLIDMYNALNKRKDFFSDYFNLLAGTDQLKKQIIEGKSIEQIKKSWIAEIEKFKKIRAKYLLYPD